MQCLHVVWILVSVFGLSCSVRRATESDCEEILNRIAELEMKESGFRDPELLRRKQQHLKYYFQREVQQCVGSQLSVPAKECVRQARSVEELSHQCLK